jgi:hypothetical protein
MDLGRIVRVSLRCGIATSLMSALPPKAGIAERDWDVRFVPIADLARAGWMLALSANSDIGNLSHTAKRANNLSPIGTMGRNRYPLGATSEVAANLATAAFA